MKSTQLGKWRVVVIEAGEKFGATGLLTHRGPDPLIEFWDTSQDPDKFVGGQFVSRYFASTLLERDQARGLILHGASPNWRIDAADLVEVLTALGFEVPKAADSGKA